MFFYYSVGNNQNKYQFIIAGAGLAGLSFIHHLLKTGNFNGKILILDSDLKRQNDRTWSFWSTKKPDYHCVGEKSWRQLGFATDDYIRFDTIDPYRYYSIKGLDFYNEVFSEISQNPGIEFKRETICNVDQEGDQCIVKTENETFYSEYLIDSISRPEIPKSKYFLNFQHFIGWFIESENEAFDPLKPILMDFRVKQEGAAGFIYLLPFSKTRALVEYTQFSPHKNYSEKKFRNELQNYIGNVLAIRNYKIEQEEIGSIPMTDFPFDSRPDSRIYKLGTSGGDTKGSTGYTFSFVQEHVKGILNELSGQGTFKRDNLRHKFYDKLLLKIISEEPEKVKEIMSSLFKDQPIISILKFLDEDTNLLEEGLIFRKLPWNPFIKALFINKRNAISI